MKKIALAVMAAVFALAGCSKKNVQDAKITKDNLKVGFVYIGSIHDEGYTTAQDKGRLALEAQGIKTMYVENVPENADCEKVIRDLIDQGCNVIYTTSFGFMDWTIKVAAEFPNVKFGHCSGYKRADKCFHLLRKNVRSTLPCRNYRRSQDKVKQDRIRSSVPNP